MKKFSPIFLFFSSAILCHAQTNTFPDSGNVGIGTTMPTADLEVAGTIKADKLKVGP